MALPPRASRAVLFAILYLFIAACAFAQANPQISAKSAQSGGAQAVFGPPPATQCPASLGYAPPAVPGLGAYSSRQQFVYGDIMWKPAKRVTTTVGYAGSFVGGNTLAIDPLQVPGTLAFNYQKPYVRAIFDLYKGVSYRMTWNYYGYDGKGLASNAIPGLAAIPTQDFNGSTVEFALRYAF